jgi:hypothetical protein
MSRYTDSLLVLLAVLLAVVVGYADLHSDDLFIVAGVAAGCAFVLGLIQADGLWRWGVLIGLGIPVAETIAVLAHIRVPYETQDPTPIGMLLVFAVSFGLAFTGAIAGAIVRRVILVSDGDVS